MNQLKVGMVRCGRYAATPQIAVTGPATVDRQTTHGLGAQL